MIARRLAVVAVLSLVTLRPAFADWLVFRSGDLIETKGPLDQKGATVQYHSLSDTLYSVRADDIDLPSSLFLSASGYRRPAQVSFPGPPELGTAADATACAEGGAFVPVESVVDGDTIKVRFGQRVETVRISCVDTPETKHPSKPVQYFGAEATAYTRSQVEGATVCLEGDDAQPQRDKYGRLLAYVRLQDGRDLGASIVAGGYGTVYTGRCSRKDSYSALAQRAAQVGTGLWSWRPSAALPLPQSGRFATIDLGTPSPGIAAMLSGGGQGSFSVGGTTRGSSAKHTPGGPIYVRSYYRADGTYVRAHTRALPTYRPK